MTYYSLLLEGYGIDSFNTTVEAGGLSLFMQFTWPTEMQKLYDMRSTEFQKFFDASPMYLYSDPKGYQRAGKWQTMIDNWKQYATLFDEENLADALALAHIILWPMPAKDTVDNAELAPASRQLRDLAQSYLDSVEPILEYLNSIDEHLIWHVNVNSAGIEKEGVLCANAWMFYGSDDYKLYPQTTLEHIKRDDLSQVKLYIAIGTGDV
jgi:hypothetical protein